MEPIGKAYLKGYCENGSIHTDTYSIRISPVQPIPDGVYMFTGDIYLDPLDRPYIAVENKLDINIYTTSFITILMHPKDDKQIEYVELQDTTKIWVDFKHIDEKCPGYYRCDLEFRNGIWYFVPKGVDKVYVI